MKPVQLYMAYNHNMTPLMAEAGTKAEADAEAKEYTFQTENKSIVLPYEEQS